MASSYLIEDFHNVGLCNCCLQNNSYKRLWDDLCWEGDSETYIALLSKCFSITFEYYNDSRICDDCIVKLTAAVEFKKQVIEAAKQLKSLAEKIEEKYPEGKNEPNDDSGDEYHIVISKPTVADNIEENIPEVKIEPYDRSGDYEYHIVISEPTDQDAARIEVKNKGIKDIIHGNASFETTEMTDISDNQKSITKQSNLKDVEALKLLLEDEEYLENNKEYCDNASPDDVNHDNVSIDDDDTNTEIDPPYQESSPYFDEEYLEVEEEGNSSNTVTSTPEQQTSPQKRKRSRKKKTHESKRSYRNYAPSALEDSLEAVRTGKFTPAQSSRHYGVPRKTIARYLWRERQKMDPELWPMHLRKVRKPNISTKSKEDIALSKQQQLLLIEEIKTVLMYTNVTPFKVGKNTLYCAYCYMDGPLFEEDPDGLRTHTRTAHASERLKKIDMFLQPFYNNEILRLDVLNLACNVCNNGLTWDELTDHLKSHNIEVNVDIVKKQLVPFILKTSDQRCFVCGMFYPNFHRLDIHMNTHSSNYICVECGETYLTSVRLRVHSKLHGTERFPCNDCDKVFTCETYRAKHIKFIHTKNYLKCQHCDEKFNGEPARQRHTLAAHRDIAKVYNCEFCGMLFTWKQHYSDHIRKVHVNKKTFKCTQCRRSFNCYSEYTAHRLTHRDKDNPKSLTCRFCLKSYSSKNYLQQHYWRIHSSQLNKLLKE